TDVFKATLESEPAQPIQPATNPRPKSLANRRKLKTPLVEDWFTTHGRYIAVGFVLALIATVYFARMNRQSAPPAAVEIDSHSTARDHPSATAQTSERRLVKAEAKPGSDEPSGLATPAKGPPPLLARDSASETDSQAELHPPTIPQLTSQPPAADKPPAD